MKSLITIVIAATAFLTGCGLTPEQAAALDAENGPPTLVRIESRGLAGRLCIYSDGKQVPETPGFPCRQFL